ncbi:YtfJ family protein [Photobacterium sp. OFAV2-7]|uniref:YtfJ family protein n=1 Tax=Photobacterium sp. OFAV2-7 TaxID=2917748 RepID=UPI001EF710B1|nr:YtfJ family protein [Photobacterium sp. OFAV2-7]MCG7584335.1 hypothetical protein [Photobacterium sp. OFAV2-7]
MSNIVVGQPLPEFEIVKGGVATPEGAFEAWGSDELVGKATYFVANAGHAEANDMHQETSLKVHAAGDIRMCRLINAKDAPMGASMFIKGEFKKGAEGDPANLYVMDSKGIVAKALGMQKKSSVLAILDAEGTVVFTHEGAVDTDTETKIMDAIADVK